jgi:hypothetical protein
MPLQAPKTPFSPQMAGNALGGVAAGVVSNAAQGAAASAQAQATNPFSPKTQIINQGASILGTRALQGNNPLALGGINLNQSPIKTTPSGGTVIPQHLANTLSNAPLNNTAIVAPATSQGLAQYVSNNYPTPNGGQVTLDASGNVSGYTPAQGYSIDTSGSVPSSALQGNTGMNDVNNSLAGYQDLVNGVAQAQGYSPAYLQALQAQYNAQNQGSYLQSVGAGLNANLSTGNGFTGFSQGQAQAQTGIDQNLNTQQEALNTQQQTAAGIALNTQQLARTGNIAAAQTELASSPVGMEGANQINSVNALSNQFPGAGILPTDSIEVAQQKVASSPAYQAGFQSTYQTPGGGTGIYNKLNVGSGALQQNSDGSYTLVSGAAAALGAGNAANVNTNLNQLSQINAAINSSNQTLNTTQQFMNQYGLNQSGVSILSQIENSTNSHLPKAGAIAGLNADLNALRSDYAQYLTGRNGSIAGTNDEANAAIPDTVSPAQLAQVVGQMQRDGQNAANSLSAQVNQALQGITQNTNASTSGGGGNSFNSWNF